MFPSRTIKSLGFFMPLLSIDARDEEREASGPATGLEAGNRRFNAPGKPRLHPLPFVARTEFSDSTNDTLHPSAETVSGFPHKEDEKVFLLSCCSFETEPNKEPPRAPSIPNLP